MRGLELPLCCFSLCFSLSVENLLWRPDFWTLLSEGFGSTWHVIGLSASGGCYSFREEPWSILENPYHCSKSFPGCDYRQRHKKHLCFPVCFCTSAVARRTSLWSPAGGSHKIYGWELSHSGWQPTNPQMCEPQTIAGQLSELWLGPAKTRRSAQ